VFRYFPTNYVWSLSVSIAMNCGAQIGEVDQISAPLASIARDGDDAGTEKFFWSWVNFADNLVARAGQELAEGHPLSAGPLFHRACVYYFVAERMQSRDFEPRKEAYRKSVAAMRFAIEHNRYRAEYVEVPYEGFSFPAIFTWPEGEVPADGWPVMVYCNGLDSVKELLFTSGLAGVSRRCASTSQARVPRCGSAGCALSTTASAGPARPSTTCRRART